MNKFGSAGARRRQSPAAKLATWLVIAASGCQVIAGLTERSAGQAPCLHNSDCSSDQACLFQVCAARCIRDVDCENARCLNTENGNACVSAEKAACSVDGTECPGGSVCSHGACRTPCDDDNPCRNDQVCTEDSVCVGIDPSHDPDAPNTPSGTGGAAGETGSSVIAGMGTATNDAGQSSGGVSGSGAVIGSGGAGSATGGVSGDGAVSGSGGTAGTGNQTTDAGSGGADGSVAGAGGSPDPGNGSVPSKGCNQATTFASAKRTITSGGVDRTYIIDVPQPYDPSRPYRLFFAFHWIGSTSEAVRDVNYYGLKPLAVAASEPVIFVAPQAKGVNWVQSDHVLFDDILAEVKQNLCIDEARVFVTGYSIGAMFTYSLALNHQEQIRAAVGIAPVNYNVYIPPKAHKPIAWMQTTGMSDATCPWDNGGNMQGAKFIALEFAAENGCTIPPQIPTWTAGNHLCYDFAGCQAGYPTKACTFGGGQASTASDTGSSKNWIAEESWAFFKQF